MFATQCDGSAVLMRPPNGVVWNETVGGAAALAPGQPYRSTLEFGCLPGFSSDAGTTTLVCDPGGEFVQTLGSCAPCPVGSYCTGGKSAYVETCRVCVLVYYYMPPTAFPFDGIVCVVRS